MLAAVPSRAVLIEARKARFRLQSDAWGVLFNEKGAGKIGMRCGTSRKALEGCLSHGLRA
jgi:hypothetical protein